MVRTLTSSGTSLVDQVLGHAEGVSEAILEPLSTDERDLFVDLLKRLT